MGISMGISVMASYWMTIVFLTLVVFIAWLSERKPTSRADRIKRVVVRGAFLVLMLGVVVGFWLPVSNPGLY